LVERKAAYDAEKVRNRMNDLGGATSNKFSLRIF
jgi:hypothetical protein